MKSYFGVGNNYYENQRNVARYTVKTSKDLINVIIPHFDNYPLITKKKADFLLFKEAVGKNYNGDHLTQKGLEEILSLKASSNLGLSPKLQSNFPQIIPFPRPSILNQTVPHPYWLVGFTEGDGGFLLGSLRIQHLDMDINTVLYLNLLSIVGIQSYFIKLKNTWIVEKFIYPRKVELEMLANTSLLVLQIFNLS